MQSSYDVAIIGGGPAGCVSALYFARQNKSVLIVEANQRASERLAGEWLHPPALEILQDLDVDLTPERTYDSGRGFAVFPDDGTPPIVLPYTAGHFGIAIEHHLLVERIREAVGRRPEIDFVHQTKATKVEGQTIHLRKRGGATHAVSAGLIVGASGRASVAHQALGIEKSKWAYSRMAGIIVTDTEVPFEGYGHVFLGGPGPALAYRIAPNKIRFCLDVPLGIPVNHNRAATLWDCYSPVLPKSLHEPFRRALATGEVSWAANQIASRFEYGREGLALVGDAAGHGHPLTAAGMTLGFEDARVLAESPSFDKFRKRRLRESRVPEMLAIALYEVFADNSDETTSMRQAIYEMWRRSPSERMRTMNFLAGMDSSPVAFGRSFLAAVGIGSKHLVQGGVARRNFAHTKEVAGELGERIEWLLKGTLHITTAQPTKELSPPEDRYGKALKASRSRAEVVEHPGLVDLLAQRRAKRLDPSTALDRGIRALVSHQAEDGSWEGEVVWCPMLAAQYVMMAHITGTEISAARRRHVLTAFAKERLEDGTWGLHPLSEPYLFVTTLVYVAARLLGVGAEDELLVRAGAFIRREGGAKGIPSWGKFWLAMLNLYEWRGVNPVLPEVWKLPKWSPMHPSRYYCHTRQIYLGMASIFATKLQVPRTETTMALREELYGNEYDRIDWDDMRDHLREAEIFTPPTTALKLMYKTLAQLDRLPRRKKARAELLEELRNHIRYELRATHHTSISPVSGLLNIIALWLADPEDEDVKVALERFEGWIWEDEIDGTRVAGARSATWDTGFAAQALAAAAPHVDVKDALRKADAFLESQQIKENFGGEEHYYRLPPKGGYCFAGVWHGWPVSDCTAEALLGRMENPVATPEPEALADGVKFILQTQNSDGGFGSYEARRVDVPLEWLNPAEMFGDSMTEHSYVECTASCVAALAEFRGHHPDVLRAQVDDSIARAVRKIRLQQRPDGSWEGNWGVNFVYGTMFGIRGLLAGGVPCHDPAIRRACEWLLDKQREDGGWGERKDLTQREYVEHEVSQVTQTAWALSALLEAKEPEFEALERAARWLSDMQLDNGEWPTQDPIGIFFHTALLDYVLYKQYFPVWALGQFETRRAERAVLVEDKAAAAG